MNGNSFHSKVLLFISILGRMMSSTQAVRTRAEITPFWGAEGISSTVIYYDKCAPVLENSDGQHFAF